MIYISHLVEDMDMKEIISETKAGVESIDFSIADNLDRLTESVESYKKRLELIGAKHLILHGPFLDLNPVSFDSEIMKVTEKRFGQAYEAAKMLGAQKIVYHTGYNPGIYMLIGWAERIADFMNRFLQQRHEIEIVLENMYDREWEPIVKTAKMIEAKNFKLCLDIGHANCYSKIPAEEWAGGMSAYIGHVHVHDNMGDKDAHMALGCGSINAENVLNQLKNKKDCTYTIECSTRKDILSSYEVLKRILSQ